MRPQASRREGPTDTVSLRMDHLGVCVNGGDYGIAVVHHENTPHGEDLFCSVYVHTSVLEDAARTVATLASKLHVRICIGSGPQGATVEALAVLNGACLAVGKTPVGLNGGPRAASRIGIDTLENARSVLNQPKADALESSALALALVAQQSPHPENRAPRSLVEVLRTGRIIIKE